MGKFMIGVCWAVLSGCASVAPRGPMIERLPESDAAQSLPRQSPMSLAKVADMAREGTPADTIIQALRDSRANYRISLTEARDLSAQGVPYEVVEYLRHGDRMPALVQAPPAPYPYRVYPSYVFVPGLAYSFYRGPYSRYPYHPHAPRTGLYFRFGVRR